MGDALDRLKAASEEEILALSLMERVKSYVRHQNGKIVHVEEHARAGNGPRFNESPYHHALRDPTGARAYHASLPDGSLRKKVYDQAFKKAASMQEDHNGRGDGFDHLRHTKGSTGALGGPHPNESISQYSSRDPEGALARMKSLPRGSLDRESYNMALKDLNTPMDSGLGRGGGNPNIIQRAQNRRQWGTDTAPSGSTGPMPRYQDIPGASTHPADKLLDQLESAFQQPKSGNEINDLAAAALRGLPSKGATGEHYKRLEKMIQRARWQG